MKKKTISQLYNILTKISHDFIRKRDSYKHGIEDRFAGACFDCGKWAEGKDFQAGHFYDSGGHGAWLRWHPHNMNGQHSGCNMKQRQEKVKIDYTLKMIDKYGREYVDFLKKQKDAGIDADRDFYMTMIELYKEAMNTLDDKPIVKFLENLVK